MRRGHQGSVWRNENPRNFRPRGGGSMHYRTPRNYTNQHELPRFHPPNQRGFVRPPFFKQSNNSDNYKPVDHDERLNYRHSLQHLPPRPPGQRLILPYMRPMHKPINKDQAPPQHFNENFYEQCSNENFEVNRMGDVDFRHPNKNLPKPSLLTPWDRNPYGNTKPPEKPMLDRHNYERPYRRDSCETNKLPTMDYGGHRPHSSDYYGSNPVPDIDNSNSFSQSVDDTVDIIRKRLQNRNDPQYNQQSENLENEEINQAPKPEERESSFQRNQQEAPRKRIQQQKQKAKVNCDKIKNKIVHQLFKMDKDTIHKLMDNPNSSTKFEYAISSLITESQNSYNRHLRSAAEKSLCQSSTEFIHNDNNTVYEDTFIRQMQCILDPQDTILLEDIKPLVLAELSKVLQLDEFEHPLEPSDPYSSHQYFDEQTNYDQYENNDSENFHEDVKFIPNLSEVTPYDNYVEPNAEANTVKEREVYTNSDIKPTFERRPRLHSNASLHNSSSDSLYKHHRRSLDDSNETCESVPLFDSNAVEQLSEDDDPFAELDKQYHVAVDHNFIEGDYNSPQHIIVNEPPSSPILSTTNTTPLSISKSSSIMNAQIKREVDRSVVSSLGFNHRKETTMTNEENAKKYLESVCSTTSTVTSQNQKFAPGSHSTHSDNENHVSSSTMKSINVSSNSRKRTTDQKPSHRKEKRKKSESHQPDLEIISVVNSKTSTTKGDCVKNTSNDKPGDENTKDTHDIEPSLKGYSDKYVKRKETPKKTKAGEQKKIISNPALHSILSSADKDSSSSSHVSQTITKSDPKITLKTFDMFVAQPKKSSAPHQPLRNTASTVVTPKVYINKVTTVESNERNQKTRTTQTINKVKGKGTQTICSKIKNHEKSVQTDPVTFSGTKPKSKATDAFERMKEIDMEIQVLLQEKFKLYNSLESKDGMVMPSLGMTVVSVEETKDDNSSNSEDAIVEDFTNIPVEELEQIAIESVKPATPIKTYKNKMQRNKIVAKERKTSESPTLTKRSKKTKSPSISLIEQIITDDRPLEEIIELDRLEELTPKTKKKSQPKKKTLKKNLSKQINNTQEGYILKNCSVVLFREDLSKYMGKPDKIHSKSLNTVPPKTVIETIEPLPLQVELEDVHLFKGETIEEVEEVIVNDLQIDMLDVSEDIVIGDMCEIKMEDDKNASEDLVTRSEEIILDNSQSSVANVVIHEAKQNGDECKTYDYSADENLRRDSIVVNGNGDSVLAIECVDNNFLAACLDGNVYYFSGSGQPLGTLRGSNLAVTCLTVVKEKYGTTVYTGSLDSRIRYYDLETGLEKGPECNVLSPIQTMDRAWDTVFVGTRTGFVLQFECKNNMLIPISTVKFSEQSILALRALKEGPRKVLLVAARSENVTIKDAQSGLLLRTLQGPKMTVYTLLFEDGKVYCGTSSNQIQVFDYASGSHAGMHLGGKGAVCLRACGGLLFAGCYDGCVYVFREGGAAPLARLRGPDLMLLALAVHGTKIIAGYKDRSLFIWKIPLVILQEMVL